MTYDELDSLPAMFFGSVRKNPERPFLWTKIDGAYRPRTWNSVADEVRSLSAGLTALGIVAGDRVALVSTNRPQWVIAHFAIMAAGAITVPAYTTNTRELHEHVLRDSGARLAIVSTASLAQNLLPACSAAGVSSVIAMENVTSCSGIEILLWDEVVAAGASQIADVEERVSKIERDNTACLIYTSGTGGFPKGVILSHHALLSNIKSIYLAFKPILSDVETFLSFLPLSHSYEHTGGLCFPISIGAEIYFAEGVDTLATNMPEARPTIITCVPRLYEVMRQRIIRGVRQQGGVRSKLFAKAVELGNKRLNGERLSLIEWVQDRILERLIRDKVRGRFGGRLKALVSGGAPLNTEVGDFFSALGLTLLQGYGQTESAPVVSCNQPGRIKLATVGPPLPEVDVKIADDGEILVRGGLLMDGYWQNPAATAEVLKDGWLHTGDIGELDGDGFLMITDRKKDLIVNSGGENIAPQRVEGVLSLEPEIAQCMVHGDERPYLVAVVVPDEEYLAEFARRHDLPPSLTSLAGEKRLSSEIKVAVDRANRRLSTSERVKRIVVAKEPFTLDNAQMTPTLKVRRHVVREVYGVALDGLYN